MANRAVPREDLTDEENLHHMQIRLHDLEDIVARVEDRAAGSMALAEELARAKAELISQRRRAEDNARKINSILDAVIDGIISVNADGVVESANASAYRMLNSNARKLIGAHLSQFLRGLDNRDCYAVQHDFTGRRHERPGWPASVMHCQGDRRRVVSSRAGDFPNKFFRY